MRRRPMSALDIALVSLVLVVLLIFGWVAAKYWYPGSWVQHQVERLVKTEPPQQAAPPKLIRFQAKAEQPKVAPRSTHPVPIRKRKAKHSVSKLAASAVAKHSTKVVRWQHWGAAPYAHSLKEACQKAPAAIDGTSMPEAVKEHFKKALGDCKGGTTVWLTPNQPLEQMWSGPDKTHPKDWVMNNRSVGELPVLKSPDGRLYPKGAVFETAKAFSWMFVYEGKTYVLYLPLVCFNWSWSLAGPSTNVPHDCFAYKLDGRGYPVKRPLQVVVNFYNHNTADLHRLMADQCFYAQDGGTGALLRLDRECATCAPGDQQAIWPGDVQVGTKTEYIFSVYSADGKTLGFPSGYGTVYVPYWFVASSLWCFTASDTYWGNAPSWWGTGTWYYTDYYSLVERHEVQDDLNARLKKFHRIIKPDGVLGK
ncbi:MAG: hypothetical protein ACYC1Y_03345 [Minisyncoccota bacterium]